jgi:SpoVK/Ycf46/Vps4 family AAA+-type ATPase
VPIARAKRDLADLLEVSYSTVTLQDVFLSEDDRAILSTYVLEQRSIELLTSHGLRPRRKLLLHGPPGTGKTLSAFALAGELKIPVARIRIELLFSRLMGETAAALTEIFGEAKRLRAVYLFDEFDSLGRERQAMGDVGEIRRVVATFLQLLDADDSDSIFIAATNIRDSIDHALFRRFDDVLEYSLPTIDELLKFMQRNLRSSGIRVAEMRSLARQFQGLTLADVGHAIDSAKKKALLRGSTAVSLADLQHAAEARHGRYASTRGQSSE